MTVIRENMYEDAPSGRWDSFRRHYMYSRAAMVRQFYTTGIRTLPVITVVGLFSGMILGLQVGLALRKFNQEVYLGAAVMISLIREMGPFVTGICLSACVGSALAAELGTMTVNDEVAALETMSISPVRYLAAPRMGALLVMSPILAFYACVLGVIGGGLVGYTQLNVPFRQYMASAMSIAELKAFLQSADDVFLAALGREQDDGDV